MKPTDHTHAPDLAAIRDQLATTSGKTYWRSLEELANTDGFQELVHREFPALASELTDPVARRTFLKLMGASLALAGVSGCTRQPPETIVPYVRPVEDMVPGRPLFFATAMPLSGISTGVLVENHMGRPTKIEGNPDHPASLGSTDVLSQASILSLYDPDRSQTLTYVGEVRPWGAFVGAMQGAMTTERSRQGAGLRILTETVTSPTLADQLRQLLIAYPKARWHQYEPAGRHSARAAQRAGVPGDLHYRVDAADVIVSLESDFLASGPGCVRYHRDFAQGRRLDGGKRMMNRLYAVESSPTPTGSVADHRLALKPSRIEPFARALAAAVGGAGGAASELDQTHQNWVGAVAKDLNAHRGRSLVVAGEFAAPAVHALAHSINVILGNVGTTVIQVAALEPEPVDQIQSLRQLMADIDAGSVELLLILGGNPVYAAPADLRFRERLNKVPLRVHLSQHQDETSDLCHWHVPETHFLETWSDGRAYDGTVTIGQPLIAPLFGAKSPLEVLAALTPQPERTAHAIVREYWSRRMDGTAGRTIPATSQSAGRTPVSTRGTGGAAAAMSQAPGGSAAQAGAAGAPGGTGGGAATATGATAAFEAWWRRALHDGLIRDDATAPARATSSPASTQKPLAAHATAPAPQAGEGDRFTTEPTPQGAEEQQARGSDRDEPAPGRTGGGLEIIFRPDPCVYDGRFANNGWLQELPKPLTKLTWDNAAYMSPQTAERLGVANGDLITLEYKGRNATGPALIVPGHADECVTVHLGYGRTRAGRVGNGAGFNAYALRTSGEPWFGGGLQVRRAGGRRVLAITQGHFNMENRNLVRAGTLPQYLQDPSFAKHMVHEPPRTLTLYPEHDYSKGYQWGMAIDLNTCTGCNACVVACVAENNTPVVGKDQVVAQREMHWLRVDTYYSGDPANPEAHHQPVPCMHCENAPCEVVCPVAATTHSAEGLNEQVYNRCVGTRYCSHNCPYKVRRFNFFLYSDYDTKTLKMARNPDVTVRSRGVMEKCTYCVQRINSARIDAEREGRSIRDGEVVTACEGACPSKSIVFGNINDPNSRVAKLKADERNYGLLADLNTRPRTTYLASVRNPNLELDPERGKSPQGHHQETGH